MTAALRRRADALDVGDVATASQTVRRRARRRRVARSAAGGVAAVGTLALGVVAVGMLGEDAGVVRTPATEPAVISIDATTPTTLHATTAVVPTVTPSSAAPPTTPPAVSPTTILAAPPSSPSSGPTTHESAGGSIRVEVVDGGLRLVGSPVPASGYTAEVEDDRPDRVRVRFESGAQRWRITVELVDGVPQPQIDEG